VVAGRRALRTKVENLLPDMVGPLEPVPHRHVVLTMPRLLRGIFGNTDEFLPNLATAADGTVSVNFYDRRLSCPASGLPMRSPPA